MSKQAICPDCGDVMVKVTEQDEVGKWHRSWVCTNCQPTPEEVEELENFIKSQ